MPCPLTLSRTCPTAPSTFTAFPGARLTPGPPLGGYSSLALAGVSAARLSPTSPSSDSGDCPACRILPPPECVSPVPLPGEGLLHQLLLFLSPLILPSFSYFSGPLLRDPIHTPSSSTDTFNRALCAGCRRPDSLNPTTSSGSPPVTSLWHWCSALISGHLQRLGILLRRGIAT